jgi:hypothetical protein
MPYKHPEMRKKQQAEWYRNRVKENPEKIKEQNRVRNHEGNAVARRRKHALKNLGWTPEEFEAQRTEQKDKCMICGKESPSGLRPDHDHETGFRRELLCTACNTALGLFKDSTELMESAIRYLRKHGRP